MTTGGHRRAATANVYLAGREQGVLLSPALLPVALTYLTSLGKNDLPHYKDFKMYCNRILDQLSGALNNRVNSLYTSLENHLKEADRKLDFKKVLNESSAPLYSTLFS